MKDSSPGNEGPVQSEPADLQGNPRVLSRQEHNISRDRISKGALKVLYRLHNKGFKGYLVGGGVRDLYLGKTPKDFDIGTDAKPSKLKKLFKNCRIIGRRFRIAHIYFPGEDIIEVATFRQGEVHAIQKNDSVILLDNKYGSPEEDAKRRDLTINGLFYDIGSFSIIDYVGGVEDLENQIVRTIKDPDASFQEDPVRMIRALRHAARTDFQVEQETFEGIQRNRIEIQKTNISRLMEEIFKDLRSGCGYKFFLKLIDSELLDAFLPSLAQQIKDKGDEHPFLNRLKVLDQKIQESSAERYTNAVMLCVLLHTVLIPQEENWVSSKAHPKGVWKLLQAGYESVGECMRVSKRDQERVSQVLLAYRKLRYCIQRGELIPSYQKKTYLSEALDFLEIDLESQGESTDLIPEWRRDYVKVLVAPPKRRGWRSRRRRLGRRGKGGSKDSQRSSSSRGSSTSKKSKKGKKPQRGSFQSKKKRTKKKSTKPRNRRDSR